MTFYRNRIFYVGLGVGVMIPIIIVAALISWANHLRPAPLSAEQAEQDDRMDFFYRRFGKYKFKEFPQKDKLFIDAMSNFQPNGYGLLLTIDQLKGLIGNPDGVIDKGGGNLEIRYYVDGIGDRDCVDIEVKDGYVTNTVTRHYINNK